MSNFVDDFVKAWQGDLDLGSARTVPKLKENATTAEAVAHYLKVAGYNGLPDDKRDK
jgi:hypothetical protein